MSLPQRQHTSDDVPDYIALIPGLFVQEHPLCSIANRWNLTYKQITALEWGIPGLLLLWMLL